MIAYVEDRLPAAPGAVPLARHAVAVALLTEVSEQVLDDILLLSTEAVSHALRVTDQPWRLRVDVEDRVVRVTVRFEPTIDLEDPYAELQHLLFEGLSSTWSADGSTLFFEVEREPRTLVA